MFLFKYPLSNSYEGIAVVSIRIKDASALLHFRIFFLNSFAYGRRDDGIRAGSARIFAFQRNPVNSIGVFMKLVVTQLALDKPKNEQANGHAGSQAENVNQGVNLSLEKVSDGDFEIVAEHMMV